MRDAVTRTSFAGCGLIAAVLLPLMPMQALADPALMAYGQHLSQECTACHRRDGADKGIPSIVGLEVDYFVATMRFYQTGERTNPAMMSVARSLDDQQLQALAVYFGSLKPGEVGAGSKAKAR